MWTGRWGGLLLPQILILFNNLATPDKIRVVKINGWWESGCSKADDVGSDKDGWGGVGVEWTVNYCSAVVRIKTVGAVVEWSSRRHLPV